MDSFTSSSLSPPSYLTLEEHFDADKLAFLLRNSDAIPELAKTRGKRNNGRGYHCDAFPVARKYLQRSRHGRVRVHYRQNHGKGRFFAVGSMSLQSLPRKIRHTISREHYVDVDMVNAHPVILSYPLLPCPALDAYIQDREEHLKGIVLRESGREADRKEADAQYEKLRRRRIDRGDDFNHEASYMNTLLCDVENRILMEVYEFFGSPRDAVLCFDGLMLPKKRPTAGDEKYNLEACMERVENRFPGLNMELKVKAMDEHVDLAGCEVKRYGYPRLEYFVDFAHLLSRDRDDVTYPEHIDEWMDNSLKYICGKGHSYFLQKSREKDPVTKEVVEYWHPSKLASTFETLSGCANVYNYKFDHDHQRPPTTATEKKKKFFTHTCLGKSKNTANNGYIQDKLEHGLMPIYSTSDFLPHLERKREQLFNPEDQVFNTLLFNTRSTRDSPWKMTFPSRWT